MKYCLFPLGCQMNKSDAERIANVLDGMGFTSTEKEDDAELLGVVACSVRQKSIARVYSRIQKWNQMKKTRRIFTFLSGCVLPDDEVKLAKLFDLVFKINELPNLGALFYQHGILLPTYSNPFASLADDIEKGFWRISPRYSSKFQAFVPIQNGCNKFCTFCAVPYTRGREVSRPSQEILAEIQQLVLNNYKSITLLGQNVNSYGQDCSGQEINFAQLLEEIGKIGQSTGKEFWVYFTSPHPSDMSIDVLRTIAKYPCLAKHIHLPLQAGHDEVLKRMNRSYTMVEYRQIIENIRAILPSATLFTDIIVGFSGETLEQFEHTRSALLEFKFDMAYLAQYSPRPGAISYSWQDDVNQIEKKRRFQQLTEDLKQVALANNQRMIGKIYRVLVESEAERKAGYLSAHTQGLIPVQFPSTNKNLIGQFVDMRILSVTPFAGNGELLGSNIV